MKMRFFLLCFFSLCFIAFCLIGCSTDTTCKECGDSASVNDDLFCQQCASHFATMSSNRKRAESYDNWERDFQKALIRAKAESKGMLVLFTGSDWCSTCQSLYKNVLESNEFKSQITGEVILVVCDNPRNESLTCSEERNQYRKLAAELNISGVPTLFLTDSNGVPYHKLLGYGDTPASEWVKDLSAKIKWRSNTSER